MTITTVLHSRAAPSLKHSPVVMALIICKNFTRFNIICTGKMKTAPKISKEGKLLGLEMTLPIKPAATQTLANNTIDHSTCTGVGNVDLKKNKKFKKKRTKMTKIFNK